MHVLVVETETGSQYLGPFADAEDARGYAQTHHDEADYEIWDLQAPVHPAGQALAGLVATAYEASYAVEETREPVDLTEEVYAGEMVAALVAARAGQVQA